MFGIAGRLEGKGVSIRDILDAAMELYVPHGVPAEEARPKIGRMLERYMGDPNVASLLLAAILLEEELFWKDRESSQIRDDPVFLLSDEIIGMAIAECIGGTYARFEFTRYDQKKPGVIRSLGPFLDDAIAGLIAGCTSRFYSECG